MKPAQALRLIYPWTQHFGFALIFLTLAVAVISTIEVLGTVYPFTIQCAAVVGFTLVGYHVLRFILAMVLAGGRSVISVQLIPYYYFSVKSAQNQ